MEIMKILNEKKINSLKFLIKTSMAQFGNGYQDKLIRIQIYKAIIFSVSGRLKDIWTLIRNTPVCPLSLHILDNS